MPTTDEVWRLDTTDDEDSLYFQKMANKGHYGVKKKGKSRQGIYVFTADGEYLSSINSLSSDSVLSTLEEGLARWNSLPDTKKTPTSGSAIVTMNPKHRFEDQYPRDGLVLTIHSRDLAKGGTPSSPPMPTWNVDAAWFSKSEKEAMVLPSVIVGDTFEFPKFFVDRICKLHLVDSVKGQTEAFTAKEVSGSRISASVTSIDNGIVAMDISGSTKGARKGKNRLGVETKLIGSAAYDLTTKRFLQFDVIALGERWGKTRFNDRKNQQHKTPIGFTFELTPSDATPVIPGIIWAYDAPWMDWPNDD